MTLKIISLNVLSGLNEKKYPLADRIEKIIKYLKSTDADVICLQEVTKNVYPIIEKSFTEQNYCINKTTIGREFIVVLTKIKHVFTILQFDTNKSCIFVQYDKIVIVGIHLTSDLAKNSDTKRKFQLNKIMNKISSFQNDFKIIIVGDTNTTEQLDELSEFIDCSNYSICPTNFTFDTKTNFIAKDCKKDSNDTCAMYDRIYIKGFKCIDFDICSNIILSDHYPIVANIE